MHLLIARHGEDVGSPHDYQTRRLTLVGKKQAEKLGQIILQFKPTHLFCSSLQRAIDTAMIVSKYCNIPPEINPILEEQKPGGNTVEDENLLANKGYFKLSQRYNNGESYEEFTQRVKKAWNWLQAIEAENQGATRIALISHGRFMTFLLSEILGFPPKGFYLAIKNTAYFIVETSENWCPMIVLPVPGEKYV